MEKHRPRKRFGQNFLTDANIAARIVDAVDPAPADRIVEIGPGHGALTRRLLERVERLDAIELDRDLAAELSGTPGAERLTVHSADALRFDFAALAQERGGPLRVVGNLPYNISTPLLFHLLDQIGSLADLHFMLQREVVDRMAAEPGGKSFGRLSVTVQVGCEVTPLFRVPPGAFYPPPKVESAVVRIRPRPPGSPRPKDPELFAALAAKAFQGRRKTLRNALKGLCDPDCLAAAGIDPGARAETLEVSDFVRLADAAASRGGQSEES